MSNSYNNYKKTSQKTGNSNSSSKKSANTRANASSRKSSSSKMASASRKNNDNRSGKKGSQIESNLDENIALEVLMWGTLALAILLLLSNFGLCGIIGDILSAFMFGMLGLLGYVFPIVLALTVIFAVSNVGIKGVRIRVFAIAIMFICMTMLVHMFTLGNEVKLAKLYATCYQNKTGGGLIGGALEKGLSTLLGNVGSVVIILMLIVICLVILTRTTIIGSYRQYREDTREERDKAKEDRRRQLQERNVQRVKYAEQVRREKRDRKIIDRDNDIFDVRVGEDSESREIKVSRKHRFTTHRGIDFDETNISGRKFDSTVPGDRVSDIREITDRNIVIEGLEPAYSGHVDLMEEPSGQYTYIETDIYKNKKAKDAEIDQHKEYEDVLKEQEEDHSTDGEFTPKERFEVSEEAKATMRRSPYASTKTPPPEKDQTNSSAVNSETADKGRDLSNTSKASGYAADLSQTQKPRKKKVIYRKPKLDLLTQNPGNASGTTRESLMETADKLQRILKQFGVNAKVTNVSKGPSVTRFELEPEFGTKVSKITSLTDDIKLNLAVADIRMEAPIPGKAAVGIEVPNASRDTVYLRDLIASRELRENTSKLAFPVGKDISGKVVVADIAKLPHMLVAGTTGSGKSVFTNSILMSILFRATPEEVKFIIIDPKMVEFGVYNGIPHLLTPVITDSKKAPGALSWAVGEMTRRYQKFAASGTKDLKSYNAKVESGALKDENGENPEKLPQIVIIIDELADLMMQAAKEVEESICRLAQLARAAGIHLIIATQRPSVDVVTGLIKANIPSRVALLVSSGTDSRTILDSVGAEKLLGNGDMLFYPAGYPKPVRLQGAFVSSGEIQATVDFLKSNSNEVEYDNSIETNMSAATEEGEKAGDDGRDAYFVDAGRLSIEKQKGSTSMLQRYFRIGFNRAAKIMDQLYEAGVVGNEETNKPRKVLMTMEEFESKFGKGSGAV